MAKLDIVFITGMSGSGKSVALHALEDNGFYCVDNLPPELVLSFIDLQINSGADQKVAIAVDVRSAKSLPSLPLVLAGLKARQVTPKLIFLEATDDTLVHRYSETRRAHPLSNAAVQTTKQDHRLALQEAIAWERELLSPLRELAHIVDTSLIKAAKLQSIIKEIADGASASAPSVPRAAMTVVFESFAFKRGVPLDADYVFDVRMLPNPHYESNLRALTGRDTPVAAYLESQPEVSQMFANIALFLETWLPALSADHRAYVTVAIGCTGGQHRSVYLVEQLTKRFEDQWAVLKRHREL